MGGGGGTVKQQLAVEFLTATTVSIDGKPTTAPSPERRQQSRPTCRGCLPKNPCVDQSDRSSGNKEHRARAPDLEHPPPSPPVLPYQKGNRLTGTKRERRETHKDPEPPETRFERHPRHPTSQVSQANPLFMPRSAGCRTIPHIGCLWHKRLSSVVAFRCGSACVVRRGREVPRAITGVKKSPVRVGSNPSLHSHLSGTSNRNAGCASSFPPVQVRTQVRIKKVNRSGKTRPQSHPVPARPTYPSGTGYI